MTRFISSKVPHWSQKRLLRSDAQSQTVLLPWDRTWDKERLMRDESIVITVRTVVSTVSTVSWGEGCGCPKNRNFFITPCSSPHLNFSTAWCSTCFTWFLESYGQRVLFSRYARPLLRPTLLCRKKLGILERRNFPTFHLKLKKVKKKNLTCTAPPTNSYVRPSRCSNLSISIFGIVQSSSTQVSLLTSVKTSPSKMGI